MNEKRDDLLAMLGTYYFAKPRPDGVELRERVRKLASVLDDGFSEAELEDVAQEVEFKDGIHANLGGAVDGEDFEPWLDDVKADIEWFYWRRYRDHLVRQGLPKEAIKKSIDEAGDKILTRLGNPREENHWDRRGMVVGHVQSGKTANYTGLICKAADAGYRLIIVIAGVHNNLRNQTQERIDDGFIGRDTSKTKKPPKGVGHFTNWKERDRNPVALTTSLRDFNKAIADTNTSQIASYKVPVVLVVKKNSSTLVNLLDWLEGNKSHDDEQMISQPMLLVDDEADNASINTKYGKEDVTRINILIRRLLSTFHRSSYVGYTATPFANIFINPDQVDEMRHKKEADLFKEEDLFPRDFIVGLEAPSNYFGASRVFGDPDLKDGESYWLRRLDDNEDVLPVKHRKDFELTSLPNSLSDAMRAFLLARTIRNMRGQTHQHCSMLVNASRFTDMHGRLKFHLQEALEGIQDAVRVEGNRGKAALKNTEMKALHRVWAKEYQDGEFKWKDIQAGLHDAIAAAKVVEVNSQTNELDYSASGERGQTVIAVGGFSLSRGLTLNGLTTTWFLRNSMAYDTLMQMGRWFGYHKGYEDLCRIWMPQAASGWYAFIANAAEELFDELKSMEDASATPRDFGLAVRHHPASLLVTARNKMGASKRVKMKIGLANKFVETAWVSIDKSDIERNRDCARCFVKALDEKGFFPEENAPWGYLAREVPAEHVLQFLANWRNAEQSVTTDPKMVRAYISGRIKDELATWDILFPSLGLGRTSGESRKVDNSLGLPIRPPERSVSVEALPQGRGFMSFSGRRMRVASRGIEVVGVDPAKAEEAKERFRKDPKYTGKENFPDRIFRRVRDRGLLIVHFVQAKASKDETDASNIVAIPSEPVVAWGLSLPGNDARDATVEYVVNTVRYRELFGDTGDADEDEKGVENGGS